jgi:hypothetical protein
MDQKNESKLKKLKQIFFEYNYFYSNSLINFDSNYSLSF